MTDREAFESWFESDEAIGIDTTFADGFDIWLAGREFERERCAQSILTGIDLQHIMNTVYGPYTVNLCNALAEAIRKGPTP